MDAVFIRKEFFQYFPSKFIFSFSICWSSLQFLFISLLVLAALLFVIFFDPHCGCYCWWFFFFFILHLPGFQNTYIICEPMLYCFFVVFFLRSVRVSNCLVVAIFFMLLLFVLLLWTFWSRLVCVCMTITWFSLGWNLWHNLSFFFLLSNSFSPLQQEKKRRKRITWNEVPGHALCGNNIYKMGKIANKFIHNMDYFSLYSFPYLMSCIIL